MANENMILIGGRLHSIATGNVVVGANEVWDDELHMKQDIINKEIVKPTINDETLSFEKININ